MHALSNVCSCVLFALCYTEQKHVVKVTAMQTLTDVLQAASSKFKPALQPEQCELQLSKKPVDLRTPFRLLNVSAGSKLEIIKSEPICIAVDLRPHLLCNCIVRC
jgi:hypothetical protein